MYYAQFEILETGRFRFTVSNDEDSETSTWTPAHRVAVVRFDGNLFLGVSPFFEDGLPACQVYSLREVETEVEQIGVD